MKEIFTILCVTLAIIAQSQSVADLEEYNIGVDTFLSGVHANGAFASGDVEFLNDYNDQFMAWTGFAVSSMTDTVSPGFLNQYSSMAGHGANSSQNYVVAYGFDPVKIILNENVRGRVVKELMVCNNAFAYYSMLNGDQFSKKFGGVNGEDEDYFKLTIRGFFNGQILADSVEFYLADFRFDDNSRDYIIRDWTQVSLDKLGPVDSLLFFLSSSDNGGFGMNTPAYFCVDNVVVDVISSSSRSRVEEVTIFPNPSKYAINVPSEYVGYPYSILDQLGRELESGNLETPQLHISHLEAGQFFLRILLDDRTALAKWVKE